MRREVSFTVQDNKGSTSLHCKWQLFLQLIIKDLSSLSWNSYTVMQMYNVCSIPTDLPQPHCLYGTVWLHSTRSSPWAGTSKMVSFICLLPQLGWLEYLRVGRTILPFKVTEILTWCPEYQENGENNLASSNKAKSRTGIASFLPIILTKESHMASPDSKGREGDFNSG